MSVVGTAIRMASQNLRKQAVSKYSQGLGPKRVMEVVRIEGCENVVNRCKQMKRRDHTDPREFVEFV